MRLGKAKAVSRHPWLDPGMKNVHAVSELLKPYDAQRMRCYPVSTRINHVANDDATTKPETRGGA
jgi:putative SOS response-associated peptidase YedK